MLLQSLKNTWDTMKNHPITGENKKFAIGCDGMSKEKFEQNIDWQLKEIARKIEMTNKNPEQGYSFGPLLYYERKKSSGGVRKIYIPRIKDQLVLKWIHNELVEKAMLQGIYLTTKSPHHIVLHFRENLKQYKNPVIVRTDIKSFFDTIPREKVVSLACNLNLSSYAQKILKVWSSEIVARPMWFAGKTKDKLVDGLPQGLSISAALAELWGTEIERKMQSETPVFRYVDDIAFICNSETEAKVKLKELEEYVQDAGLRLSPSKTQITSIKNGVEWLGLKHFKNEVYASPERLERWMKRFQNMRVEAMNSYKQQAGMDKQLVLQDFFNKVKKELSGKTSARPQWYSIVEDKGQWRAMDVQLHAQFKILHKQLGLPMDKTIKLPSVHKTMTARSKYSKIGSPQITD